jgi:hypothetical protein
MSTKTAQITRLTAPELAKLLSVSARQKVTEAQVLAIAEKAGICQPDGTINLIEYTAVLVSEVSHSPH